MEHNNLLAQKPAVAALVFEGHANLSDLDLSGAVGSKQLVHAHVSFTTYVPWIDCQINLCQIHGQDL